MVVNWTRGLRRHFKGFTQAFYGMATPSHPNIRTMTLSGANTNRPFTIVVEGNIGSGKTTFLNEFKDMENELEIMPEPVDKWRNCQD